MDRVLFDGDCGLCHRAVLFALRHDPDGTKFRFAPLPPHSPVNSVIVMTGDGRTLLRSDAVIRLLERSGPGWSMLGATLRILPRPLRDAGYRGVARIRRRLFAPPAGTCPVVPPHLRNRFDP
jgi:predicted DCC family thiol-disulfide oxidoreductase YuxK